MTATIPPETASEHARDGDGFCQLHGTWCSYAPTEPPETATERTQPLDVDALWDALDQAYAEDAIAATGYPVTPERVRAEVDRRRHDDAALLARQTGRALVDATPLGREYAEHVAAAQARVLGAGR